jgi:hypothetical protein
MPPAGYGPSPSPLRLQATRANEPFPAKVHLGKLGGGTIQLPEQKSITSTYKHSNVSNKYLLHSHTPRMLILKQKGHERPVIFRLEGRRLQERLGTGSL